MTGAGTNTYLVGTDDVVVIDPGPDEESHIQAIFKAGAGRIRWILCTHTHTDHSPGVPRLKHLTGAKVGCMSAPLTDHDLKLEPDAKLVYGPSSFSAAELGLGRPYPRTCVQSSVLSVE